MAIRYTDFAIQAKQMRDQLVAAATEEADRWLNETLAMLRRLPNAPTTESSQLHEKGINPSSAETQSNNGMSLATLTKKVVMTLGKDQFNSVEIRQLIEPHFAMDKATQRANLANLLKRMVQRGDLDLVRQGKGSRPSVFRRKGLEVTKKDYQG